MNFNNADMADNEPISIRFARKVGAQNAQFRDRNRAVLSVTLETRAKSALRWCLRPHAHRRLFAAEEVRAYLDRLERTKFLAPGEPDSEVDPVVSGFFCQQNFNGIRQVENGVSYVIEGQGADDFR